MNKVILTLISILVVMIAIFTAVMIVTPNSQKEAQQNLEIEIAEEEILDDCTDEYEGMEQEQSIKANTQEEKTSPNCSVTTKTYFSQCGHTKTEYANLPQEFVNLNQQEIQEKYPDYEIESFTSNEIILSQKKPTSCLEHYLVKDKEGQVAIYQVLEDGTQKEIEMTGITTEYLPETDKINMEKGIRVNGKQELNRLIEDFE